MMAIEQKIGGIYAFLFATGKDHEPVYTYIAAIHHLHMLSIPDNASSRNRFAVVKHDFVDIHSGRS